MELAVAAFERIGDTLDGIDDIQALQQRHINPAGISDQPKNGLILAKRGVNVDILIPQPVDKLVSLFFRDIVF